MGGQGGLAARGMGFCRSGRSDIRCIPPDLRLDDVSVAGQYAKTVDSLRAGMTAGRSPSSVESGLPMALRYLTVQDMLWINLEVTGKPNRWNYARLEEGTFNQYGYGQSVNLLPQAATFVGGFIKQRPFTTGNRATALVGVATFLAINDHELVLDDSEAAVWIEQIEAAGALALPELESRVRPLDSHGHELSVKDIATEVMARYATSIARLNESEELVRV